MPKTRKSKTKAKPSPRKAARRLPPPPPVLPRDLVAFTQAKTAFHAGALGEATARLLDALTVNPRRAEAHVLLSSCWSKRGDYTRALEAAVRATELEPANPAWWNNLGRVHQERRSFQDAKHAYLRAISSDPGMAEAYYQLARTELHLGETQAAADHLVQALSQRPELAQDARREFPALAAHPRLSEWLASPEEPKRSRARRAPRKR